MADPREVFPVEVWEMILECVDEPQDILCCSRTCTLFRNYLSRTRAFTSVFPSIFQYLSNKDILQCRLVSKRWLNVVDNFQQSNKFAPTLVHFLKNYEKILSNATITRIPKHHPINLFAADLLRVTGRPWRITRNGNWIPDNRGAVEVLVPVPEVRNDYQNPLEEFISVFEKAYEKNPFPSRAVILIITDKDIDHVLQFLNLFGCHNWSLGIAVRLRSQGFYKTLQLIWKVLDRVPNLKHLFFGEDLGHKHFVQEATDFNVRKLMNASPTPVLKLLKRIELKITNPIIKVIIEEAFSGPRVTIS